MGLAISVGVLSELKEADPEGGEWFAAQMDEVNRVLRANNLPAHSEPEELPLLQSRAAIDSFPYSWLHYLRRAVAYSRQRSKAFRPLRKGEDPTKDALLESEMFSGLQSHVICHSDCEGFYVPVDFPAPLFDDQNGRLAGDIVGSARPALMELVAAAPLLDIRLAGDALADEEADRINADEQNSHPLWIERTTWLTFYEALRLGIAHKSAVVFQ